MISQIFRRLFVAKQRRYHKAEITVITSQLPALAMTMEIIERIYQCRGCEAFRVFLSCP